MTTKRTPHEKPPLPWRVYWWDFTHSHDWIGRQAERGKKLKRAKPPPRLVCDFLTLEEAEAFVAHLRTNEDIVAQVVSMRELLPLAPETPSFGEVGYWPRQSRRMTGPEWPGPPRARR